MSSHWIPDFVLLNNNKIEQPISFDQCFIDLLLNCDDDDNKQINNEVDVTYTLKDGRVTLSSGHDIKLHHPVNCPLRKLTCEQKENLQDGTIAVGAAILLRSSDGFIMLTRRSQKLKTFPGLWVPPGGHVEESETFKEAGIREVHEEVGIMLNCNDEALTPLCLFESCYPPFIEWGLPRRRHLVIYYLAQSERSKDDLMKEIHLEEREVDAYIWLNNDTVECVVKQTDNEQLTDTNIYEVNDGMVKCTEFDIYKFFETTEEPKESDERLSTGTRLALKHAHCILTNK